MECRLCKKPLRPIDPFITEAKDTYVHMTCYAAEKARQLLVRRAAQNTPHKK